MGKLNRTTSADAGDPISHEIAARWHENFKGRQHPFITDIVPRHDIKIAPYEIGGFIDMLRTINTTAATGMRVYFACFALTGDNARDNQLIPKNTNNDFMLGSLTLIYVRTINDGYSVRRDDKEYFVMDADGKGYSKISFEIASKWVTKYETTIHGTLSNLGDLGSSGETRQLWYSKAVMDANITALGTGTLNPGPSVTAFFCAYNADETINCCNQHGRRTLLNVRNQLSVVFGTGPVPIDKNVTIETMSFFFFADGNDYDTGIPIPPASPGGDSLP